VTWGNVNGRAILQVGGVTIEDRDGLVLGDSSRVIADLGLRSYVGDTPAAECFVDNVAIRILP
jgi:hypothetical protein